MLIHVKIFPESKKKEIIKKSDTQYEVFVKAKAERNMANIEMREMLADYFKIDLGAVKIITGHHSPSKILEIKDEKKDR